MPFWRDKEKSGATAKLRNTRVMLGQIDNLRNTLKPITGKPNHPYVAPLSAAATDGKLGLLHAELRQLIKIIDSDTKSLKLRPQNCGAKLKMSP